MRVEMEATMRQRDIEIWALNILQRVETEQPHEDSRVELKAKWPGDFAKTARQIAGHANTARGEPILWLIGVDQKAGVIGAVFQEISTWWPQVTKQFAGIEPVLVEVNVPYRDTTVVALQFDTDRAPYVVKNPAYNTDGGGPISLEVPWRGSTSVRTAKREELLLLLAPLQYLPEIELLEAQVWLAPGQPDEGGFRWNAEFKLYITPPGQVRLVLPFHRCKVTLQIHERLFPTPLGDLRISPPWIFRGRESANLSKTMESTETEILISGPGVAYIRGGFLIGGMNLDLDNTAINVRFQYRPSGMDKPGEIVFQVPTTMLSPQDIENGTITKWAVVNEM